MAIQIPVDFSKCKSHSLRSLGIVPQFFNANGLPITAANQYFITQSRRWSINTIKTYAEHLIIFLNWVEALEFSLEDCDQHSLELYAHALCSNLNGASSLSWNTIDRRVRLVGAFLRWCSENNYISTDTEIRSTERQYVRGTFQKLGHPAKPIQRPTRWIPMELALKLITRFELDENSTHSIRNALIARLMLESGMRLSEVTQFPLSDLPQEDSQKFFVITPITGKGRKQRLVALSMKLVRDLHGYVDLERERIIENLSPSRRKSAVSLFLSHSGKPLSRGWVEKMFRTFSVPLGARITPHMLRHTFGTYHYHLHKDLPLLRSLMGHSSMETTERFYVHTAVLSGYSAEFAALIEGFGSSQKICSSDEN